ncbi:hypothetical protein HRbin01_00738 [archaeon HR01]|nr:hypothetical protein HRbin01_00738 [archaeon HR01]
MRIMVFNKGVAAVFLVDVGRLVDVEDLLEKVRGLGAGCEVQIFNPEMVVDWTHLEAAYVAAVLSINSGAAKSRSLGYEFLCRLAATTQVSKAIETVGIRPGSGVVGVIVLGEDVEAVSSKARKILEGLGAAEAELRPSWEKTEKIARAHSIQDMQLERIQAPNKMDAARLAIIQKISSSLL